MVAFKMRNDIKHGKQCTVKWKGVRYEILNMGDLCWGLP